MNIRSSPGSVTGETITRRHFLKTAGVATAALTLGTAYASPQGESDFAADAARSGFLIRSNGSKITSLKYDADQFVTEYIEPGKSLGDVSVAWRQKNGPWQRFDTGSALVSSTGQGGLDAAGISNVYGAGNNLAVETAFSIAAQALIWQITVTNSSPSDIEIGDLSLALPMNTNFQDGQPATSSVLKHSFISGHSSFLFWMRCNSVGPYLMAVPLPGTSFEYWDKTDGYAIFIHSKAASEEALRHGSVWRQPHTSVVVGPGKSLTYGLKFEWASDYNDVRAKLVANGLVDVSVVPGMTVPTDQSAMFALDCRKKIHEIVAEYPESTDLKKITHAGDRSIYSLKFARLGENKLTVRYGDSESFILEFFSCQPVETLFKKRASFTAKHQHRDASKWYNGLLAEWNMDSQTLLGPDNYDKITGWRIYEVTCDDPGLSKPAYLAAKNAEYPVQEEIDSLDYYITNFVWGGLQRTTSETYPYGIYGIPDWRTNRDSAKTGADGQLHIWRIYDYSHIVLMYLSLYKAASRYPNIRTALTAKEYLVRAYGTAAALYTIPLQVANWSAYETGLYNELCIVELIDILAEEGMVTESGTLREHWRKKVEFFVTDSPNLFGSEYPFDSTGFESTHAIAKYALANPSPTNGSTKAITVENARSFMQRQMAANIFCRGSIEPAYYLLGSDYRASAGDAYTLSYMAQMGGWAVLDFAVNYASDPFPYLRLGYASFLSSWALVNSGDSGSNFGYWYPGEANDGGAGGGFEPAAFGYTWLDQPHHRGSWYYSCEINLGYCGALRTAASIFADDPIFGRICLGGNWRASGSMLEVSPRDGLRRRFHALIDGKRFSLSTAVDRFDPDWSIAFNESLTQVHFKLETDITSHHQSQVQINGLAAGDYDVSVGIKSIGTVFCDESGPTVVSVPVDPRFPQTVTVRKIG